MTFYVWDEKGMYHVHATEDGAREAVREQRRYEIAKECLAGMMSPNMLSWNSSNVPHYVRFSVEFADALLAELEKKP